MPKYFGMDVIYREPKSNSDAAELPRYRYAGLGSSVWCGENDTFSIFRLNHGILCRYNHSSDDLYGFNVNNNYYTPSNDDNNGTSH